MATNRKELLKRRTPPKRKPELAFEIKRKSCWNGRGRRKKKIVFEELFPECPKGLLTQRGKSLEPGRVIPERQKIGPRKRSSNEQKAPYDHLFKIEKKNGKMRGAGEGSRVTGPLGKKAQEKLHGGEPESVPARLSG